jgi:hypothetical protein
VWCVGQNIRIATLSFFHVCRKRRLKSYLYKLMNNKIDCPTLLSKINFNFPYRIPRCSCGMFKKFCRTRSRLTRDSFTTSTSINLFCEIVIRNNDLTKKIPELDIFFLSLPKILHILKHNDVHIKQVKLSFGLLI